ncbi:MAG TPA: PucR family transcriptional regulator ligand-binding domain-containing protein [Jiangellaceae bacterium]
MLPTVRQVLALPEVRRGRPRLLAGDDAISNPVRWVHVSELPDIAHLLRGGELILTTGIALPGDERGLVRYVDELAQAEASGLIIELGRRFAALPDVLVAAARRRDLPLVALERELPFVRITEAVHSIIVDAQVKQLQDAETVHRRFTELSLQGATAERIVSDISALTGRPVVLENLAHQVLVCVSAGDPVDDLLDDWEARSRFVRLTGPTEVASLPDKWLVTTIGARGDQWGRVFLRLDGEPSTLDTLALERGAGALAMNRLMEREQAGLERMAHRTIIDDIRSGNSVSDSETAARAAALGVPLTSRRLIGAVARVIPSGGDAGTQDTRARDAAETIAAAVRGAGVAALVGPAGREEIALVLALPLQERDIRGVLERVMHQVRQAVGQSAPDVQISLAVGTVADQLDGLRRSLGEAQQITLAVPGLPAGKGYYELSDIHLRGLLYLLGDDPRLQTFVEHELGPLLMYDSTHGTDLLSTLTAYLSHGLNKSAAAAAVGMSRPAFYQRLERIQRILSTDLESVEACLSLHVAVLGLAAVRRTHPVT